MEKAGMHFLSARANPSRQYMLGKLFDYQQRLELLAAAKTPDDGTRAATIDACKRYLEAIEVAVYSGSLLKGVFWKKKAFTAWHLFHRLDETFYLLMDRAELSAQGVELLQGLRNSTLPQQTKNEWIARVEKQLVSLISQKHEKASADAASSEDDSNLIHQTAHIFKSAVYVYNDFVDNLFWDIWCKKMISLVYTIMLGVMIVFLSSFCLRSEGIGINLCTVLLLGAMGGLVSGIFTAQPISIAYGHFWSVTLYHIFIRPLQGAVAALMTFWLIQSQYLISIEPPLKPGTVIVSNREGLPSEFPLVVELPKQGISDGRQTFKPISTSKYPNQTIVLRAKEGMQIYLYLLVLLIAGFSGDKVLMMVTDKVGNKLFANAEKTKEVKEV